MPWRPTPRLAWRSPVATADPGREPVRTCVGCRRRGSPRELTRVTRAADGKLVVGRSARGRGAWLCAGSPRCLAEAVRRRAFDRALRGTVSGADELARTVFGPDQANMRDLFAAGAVPEAALPKTLTKG